MTYPVIACLALHRSFLVVTAVALATAVTTKDQTAALKPDSDEFPAPFWVSSVAIMAASSAATHFALSLRFFLEGRPGASFALRDVDRCV